MRRLIVAMNLAVARLPVVTTPVGAEGLGLSSGTHALIAPTPEDFAKSVVMIFRDPALAQSIAVPGGSEFIRCRRANASPRHLSDVFTAGALSFAH
jgi:hypothetical protein